MVTLLGREPEASFLKQSWRLHAKMSRALPLHRRELVPRRKVGAYASLKKLTSGIHCFTLISHHFTAEPQRLEVSVP
jgi:hypothetical protein